MDSRYIYSPHAPSLEPAPGSATVGWLTSYDRLTPSPYHSPHQQTTGAIASAPRQMRHPNENHIRNAERLSRVTDALREAGLGAQFTPDEVRNVLEHLKINEGAAKHPSGSLSSGPDRIQDSDAQVLPSSNPLSQAHACYPSLERSTPAMTRNSGSSSSSDNSKNPHIVPQHIRGPHANYAGTTTSHPQQEHYRLQTGNPLHEAGETNTAIWNDFVASSSVGNKPFAVPRTSHQPTDDFTSEFQGQPSNTRYASYHTSRHRHFDRVPVQAHYHLPDLGIGPLRSDDNILANARMQHIRSLSEAVYPPSTPIALDQPRTLTTYGFIDQGQTGLIPGLHHANMSSLSTTQQSSSSGAQRLTQREFRPMEVIVNRSGAKHAIPPHLPPQTQACVPGGFSANYHGKHTERNASKDWLPDVENSSLWICNLPPDVSYHELLSLIRGIGRVHCTVINRPDPGKHPGAAAKVVFYEASAAQKFHAWVNQMRPYIRGFGLTCKHNRIKTASEPLDGTSRVVIITGKSWYVNQANLTRLFTPSFVYQLDEVIELAHAGDRTVLEFRFGSYRCQSEMAMIWMRKCAPAAVEMVEYGPDPCEVGDETLSRQIAAERVRGHGLVWPWPRHEGAP